MSKHKRRPWLKFRTWYPAWKIRSRLIDYPVYMPPNPQNEIQITAHKAAENFEYFLRQRSSRLQYFVKFMKEFKVDAETTDDGLISVSNWFDRHGGLLLHFQPPGPTNLL